METDPEWHIARAQLEWLLELGVTETIGETPIDRYGLKPPPDQPKEASVPVSRLQLDPLAEARKSAQAAGSLPELRQAITAYGHCELKKGARNTVFCDGQAGARLMIIGEAPGRDEDRLGRPFVGRAGQLLDRMLAFVDLDRKTNVYITNVLPWRPPQNRDPRPEEINMMRPFLMRHIELANPEFILAMGNISCLALIGRKGILKLRGKWAETHGKKPVLPTLHPAYLLRSPGAKSDAWNDLLEMRARLDST